MNSQHELEKKQLGIKLLGGFWKNLNNHLIDHKRVEDEMWLLKFFYSVFVIVSLATILCSFIYIEAHWLLFAFFAIITTLAIVIYSLIEKILGEAKESVKATVIQITQNEIATNEFQNSAIENAVTGENGQYLPPPDTGNNHDN